MKLYLLLTIVIFLFWAVPVYAQVTVNTLANVDFGRVEFAPSYSANIQLGTDGNVSVTGFGIVSDNDGNAGEIEVTMPNTGIVEVKCAQTAQMVSPSATPLGITNIEIAVNTGVVFGSATSCQGAAIADPVTLTLDMDALTDPNIFVGGEIAIPGIITLPPNMMYSSSGGGTPISLSLVVQ